MRTHKAVPGLALVLGAAMLTLYPVTAAHAATSTTLVVQANQSFRTVTHVATGSLYGLATASTPADSLVEPLHPNTFVQMPAGGHQQGSGDILKVAPEAAKAGAKLVDRLSDYYAGWPYQFSWSTWSSAVSSQISQIKASGITNLASYELWNEPDNTWLTANGTFNAFWTQTFNQVRSLAPGVPIQGPSFSDNISGMQSFLQNAVATNTVPDIISWHELESSSKIAGDVTTVQNLEKSLGISPRPIAIEEYAAPAQVGIPGDLIGYIAEFERLGINNAELAFWNQSGALGDLLTGQGGSPNGAYWLYDWYGAMTGTMVTTTPSGALDGAASVPPGQNQVNVIFGAGSGATAVTINGLNALSGFSGSTQATVTLQDTPGSGRTTAVTGPTTLSQSTYTVTNGSITVPISSMNATYAYHLVVTPISSTGNTVTVTNPGAQTATAGSAVSGLQVHATDSASGQTLTYSASGLPAGLSISSSGLVSGTPTVAGTSSVTVTAKDSTGASGSASFTWTVGSGSTGGGTCQVSYVKDEWSGGFTANLTVTNSGSTAINGWTLNFTFPGDQKITNGWNATVTQSGSAVTATNMSYNAAIAPGANAQFGFQGTWTSNDTGPTAFTLNGTTCTG